MLTNDLLRHHRHTQCSWENGTRAQALLEIDHPELSVFYNPCLPITDTSGIPEEVNAIAEYTIAHKPNNTLMLTEDGSAADPASLGVAVLLANATLANVDYMPDIDQQNEWLLVVAPRTVDGALSHRVSQVQLWSDFIYMVPPYLAYYGAMTANASMIQAACALHGVFKYRVELLADLKMYIIRRSDTLVSKLPAERHWPLATHYSR